MKKLVLVTLFFAGISTDVSAQNYVWSKGIGAIGADEIRSSKVDGAGNIYVAGAFSGTVDFDPGPGVANLTSLGNTDIFIAKYDPAGGLLWANGFGGTVQDYPSKIDVDAAGNVYATGTFQNTVDFNPANPGTSVVASNGLADVFFIKYDPAGAFMWVKRIGSLNNDVGYGLRIDNNTGAIYLSGTFYNSPDFDPGPGTAVLTAVGGYDMFVARFDNSGNYIWARGFGSATTENFWNLDIDNSGNVYVIGYFQGTVNFNAGSSPAANLTSSGILDIVIAKYNASGNYVWAKKMGGTGSDYGRDIRVDGAGNVYVTGYFANTANFNPGGTANLISAGLTDVYLAKYDNAGNYIWAKKMGGSGNDNGWALDVDNLGSIYLTGYFASPTANFNPGGSAILTNAGGATSNGFVAKYDTAGTYIWANSIGGSSAFDDFGYAVSVHSSGDIYAGGAFSATVDLDFSAPVAAHTSGGTTDIYLAKYSQCPLPVISNISASSPAICSGGSTTLTVSGNLNGATHWQWYEGTCGGNALSSGSSVNVSPSSTTIYYVRGEGGCTGGVLCDSVTVTVIPVAYSSQSIAICQGDSLYLGGNWRKISGVYLDTLVSAAGCDSVRTTTLSVVSAIVSPVASYICQGDSVMLGGAWQKNAGVYLDTLTSAFGCDSVIVTSLTTKPVYLVPLAASICQGDSLYLAGGWQKTAGAYYDTLSWVWGCDSVIATTLTVKPVYNIPVNAGICQGDSIYLGGVWRKTAGTYTTQYQSSVGCDSSIVTTLTVFPTYNIPVTASICQGDSLFLEGSWRKLGGVYIDTFQSAAGCDSVQATTLIISPKYSVLQNVSVCQGDSIWLGGAWQTASGTYFDTLTTVAGCDSVIISTLSVDFLNLSVSINGRTLTSNTNAASWQWLDCSNGGVVIPGATGQSYTAPANGSYAVIVGKGACLDTSLCYYVLNTDISGYTGGLPEVTVYPNPAGNYVNIDLGVEARFVAVKLTNMRGETVLSDHFQDVAVIRISLESLAQAIYVVHLVADDQQRIFKVMKR